MRGPEALWERVLALDGYSDGEAVDLFQHSLQTADLAAARGLSDEIVVAGLVHDIGTPHVAETEHARYGAALVEPALGAHVAWVVGAHVEAKRYLCARDPEVVGALSDVSRRTLALQGGPMSPAEAARFESHPWHEDAVALRLCDDLAKDPARCLTLAEGERFRLRLLAVARRCAG
jgi:gamma-butyrobetaine dioxygenase